MELKILATSDMHGYLNPTNFAERNLSLPFGTTRVASLFKVVRQKATGPVVAIENGDFIQGSPLSYYVAKMPHHEVNTLTQVINRLHYDCGIIGNHEFNYGLPYLKTALKSYQHPVVCANLLNDQGEPFFGQPYYLLEKEGVKIAVLGLTTQYIPHWEQPATIQGITFESIVTCAKHYVPQLRKLADVVIVAYHGGFERDLNDGEPTEALTGENEGYALLKEVPGIDALVTGHQHREIATKLFGVPVIQPGYRGAFVGEITLQLKKTAQGYAVTDSFSQLLATKDYAPDAELVASIAELSSEVETWLDQPCGKVEGDMLIHDPMAARLTEHPYIELINKVQMAASGAKISGAALFNNEGHGFNPTITMRDIITNYIYPNTLAVLKISGADLKAALEKTATFLSLVDGQVIFNPRYVNPKPQYYNYDMYEGIKYTIDLRLPEGQRVTRLMFDSAPVEPTASYEVVMNQYRGVGGGNYAMFSPTKIVKEIQVDMTELIAEYLKKYPVIEATVNNNFTILF